MRRPTSLVLLMITCLILALGCGNKDDMQKTSDMSSDSHSESAYQYSEEKENGDEQDIMSMFFEKKETNWEYIDCALIPDGASGRVGAVLFWNSEQKRSGVAFFDPQGNDQKCEIDAKVAAEPHFTYLGEGAVSFKMETDQGEIYNYTLTLSIDGSHVHFKGEDDLPES